MGQFSAENSRSPGQLLAEINKVFVAGDASRDVLQIAVAMGEGSRAAVAINKALLLADGLSD